MICYDLASPARLLPLIQSPSGWRLSFCSLEFCFVSDGYATAFCMQVMRSNHGDEYIITELNPVEWTPHDTPKVKNLIVHYIFYCVSDAVTLICCSFVGSLFKDA